MKKTVNILLSLAFLAVLAGCNKKDASAEATTEAHATEATADAGATAPTADAVEGDAKAHEPEAKEQETLTQALEVAEKNGAAE